ncbi:hypothetical protein KAH81_01285 [bacterium]|nr:hypothetical protein [bacterium]
MDTQTLIKPFFILASICAGVLVSYFFYRFFKITIERERTLKALEERENKLKKLNIDLIKTEERERHIIAEMIHDRIGVSLAALKIFLKRYILSNDTDSRESIGLFSELDDIIDQTNKLVFEISPPILRHFGLEPALRKLNEDFESQFGMRYFLECNLDGFRANDQTKSFLYRSIRELLVNAVKHAKASRTEVRLDFSKPMLVVSVKDNGIGFDVETYKEDKRSGGFGIFSIIERLENFGGHLHINSVRGFGTEVVISLKLEKGRDFD